MLYFKLFNKTLNYTDNYDNYADYDDYDNYILNTFFILSTGAFIGYMGYIVCRYSVNICCYREYLGLNTIYNNHIYENEYGDEDEEDVQQQNTLIQNDELNDYIKIYMNTIDNNINTKCCICLDEMKLNDYIGQLNCNHVFHVNCIKAWFGTNNNKNCPLCRESIGIIINENIQGGVV
jgi:hypothetical protein